MQAGYVSENSALQGNFFALRGRSINSINDAHDIQALLHRVFRLRLALQHIEKVPQICAMAFFPVDKSRGNIHHPIAYL